MELPMKQPAMPQQQAQQVHQPQQQEQQEQKGPFPSSKGEAMQFSNDILQVLYDKSTHQGIVNQLSKVADKDVPTGHAVGTIAAQIVGNRISDVRAQTGRPLEMRMVTDALKAVITELAEIAENNGFFTMQPEEKKQALQVAVQTLDGLGGNNESR